jgi:hypothetical protein
VAVAMLAAARVQAASITWGSPTGISGDTDVDTTGTLVGAFHVGSNLATNINGVHFAPVVLAGSSTTSGNFSFTTATTFTNGGSITGAAPYGTLSGGYQTLLDSFGGVVSPATFTLTMSGLTVGQTYEFQWWDDVSDQIGGFSHIATAGNSVTLLSNTTNTVGGLGQFAIGTFVADAISQAVVFSAGPNSNPILDGFQLRAIPAINQGGGPGVPLPQGVWAAVGGLAACGLLLRNLRDRIKV